jgi:hypothetical protein
MNKEKLERVVVTLDDLKKDKYLIDCVIGHIEMSKESEIGRDSLPSVIDMFVNYFLDYKDFDEYIYDNVCEMVEKDIDNKLFERFDDTGDKPIELYEAMRDLVIEDLLYKMYAIEANILYYEEMYNGMNKEQMGE